jgi:hypothetical protein
MLVCLPAHTRPQEWADLAASRLARHDVRTCGTMPHFAPGTRRTSKLLHRRRDTAAGGPVGLLDLDGMRRRAHAEAAGRWLEWRDVVADTRTAQPFRVYRDRYLDDPTGYPLGKAQRQYLTQPRIQAMSVYNALPNRVCELPTAELEAFQPGQATYAWLAWLSVVPADGMAPDARDGLLTSAGGGLDEQLDYLKAANAHLDRLDRTTNLVAMAAH